MRKVFGRSVRIFPIKIILCFIASTICFYFMLPSSARLSSEFTSKDSHLKNVWRFDNQDWNLNLSNSQRLIPVIESLQRRVADLEEKVMFYEKNHANVKMEKSEQIQSQSSNCNFPSFEGYGYCQTKIEWMREMWKSDSCYAEWGVDGSDCSIFHFLSQVEHWCPPLDGNISTTAAVPNFEEAAVRENFSGLYEILKDDNHYKWIKNRIQRMETTWLKAGQKFKSVYKTRWRQQKIMVHMGLLSEDSGWNIAENAFKGGPLGELVQWSDLISSLYVLGHNITVTHSTYHLTKNFNPYLASASTNCPLKKTPFDVVFIDYRGMVVLKKAVGTKFHLLLCKLRVVDSFGTEPAFNDARYALRKRLRSPWGNWNLLPQQFNTMFPHTPDNTFLGFVIEEHLNATELRNITKENITLVYGKVDAFWEGKSGYIDAIHEFTEVHGTVNAQNELKFVPSYVINHGVLPGNELAVLLRKARIFVGMGFPYEGPAPLEAIANGGVFLNPVFSSSTPQGKHAEKFYRDKPTNRRLESQHPYSKTFIGPPHVRMVDIEDIQSVQKIVKDILDSPPPSPYVPLEFTCYGMLERLAHQLERDDFCSAKAWHPPLQTLQVLESNEEESCSDLCVKHGLVCEPRYFRQLNEKAAFQRMGVNCSHVILPSQNDEEIDFPSHKDDKCYLQSNSQLFSCAGRFTDQNRLCPCRDFLKGQVALCSDCRLP